MLNSQRTVFLVKGGDFGDNYVNTIFATLCCSQYYEVVCECISSEVDKFYTTLLSIPCENCKPDIYGSV